MRKILCSILTITLLVADSASAYTTNFNNDSAKYYVVCPYCATRTKVEDSSVVNKQCSNLKCGELLDSQPIVAAGNESFKLAEQIKAERVAKANSLNIKSTNGVKCIHCSRNSELDRFELLAIAEGRRNRTLTCHKCGQSYDVLDGLKYYEIEAKKQMDTLVKGVAIAGIAVAAVAIAANSKGGGGYAPSYPQYIPSYSPRIATVARPAIIMPAGGSYTAQSLGNFNYVSGPNGYSGTGQRLGNFNYYNDNRGGNYTVQKLGNFDYVSGSNGYSGSGQRIGNFYYYNDNRGGSYTGQTLGNFDYVSGSNGYSGSGQKLGNFYYYNDNK